MVGPVYRRFAPRAGTALGLLGFAVFMASCAPDLPVEPGRPLITPQLVGPPANDNFGSAPVIAAVPFSDIVDITDATFETDERPASCAFGSASQRTVWYSFSPAVTGVFSPSINAGFSTVVAVYTGGSLASLSEVACRSPFTGIQVFRAEAGNTYYIQVDGLFGQTGSLEFRLEEIPPPPNDGFANAILITVLPFSNTVDITAASTEAGEPTPSCSFGSPSNKTAWYSFTPTETRSISGSIVNAFFSTVVAAYTGSSVSHLTEVACHPFGAPLTFRAEAGTTYYFQVDGLFGPGGLLEFRLEVTPPPVANFGFSPFDPSVFDVVQFSDFSFDPGGVGWGSQWNFGDGTSGTGCCLTHRYAADGDYTVQLTITTFDGRTASTPQTVRVRTHDVAITKFSVPNAAGAGQTRRIVVGVNSKRYPETVDVQLLKSVPGGFQQVGVLSQSVPVRPSNRTTDFSFSYTFTAADAQVGKVTFKAVAFISGARDVLPADNEAIAPPTKVSR